MKALYLFLMFLWDEFSKGKEFTVTAVSDWLDYDSKKKLGTRVDVVISADATPYQMKDGKQVSNLFEKLSFKVRKDITVSIGAKVVPVNAVATIYGQFRNQLSVKCDDIQVIQAKKD